MHDQSFEHDEFFLFLAGEALDTFFLTGLIDREVDRSCLLVAVSDLSLFLFLLFESLLNPLPVSFLISLESGDLLVRRLSTFLLSPLCVESRLRLNFFSLDADLDEEPSDDEQ